MFATTPARLVGARVAAPSLGFTLDTAVDHPRAWLEMLELLPCSARGSDECARLELAPESGGGHLLALRRNVTPVICNGTWVRGARLFHLEVVDQAPVGSVALQYRVKANADKVDVRLEVLSISSELRARPETLAATAQLLASAFSTASREVIHVYHRALSPDLADATVNLSVVVPNGHYQDFLEAVVSALRAQLDADGTPGEAYAPTCEGLLADAIVAPRAPADAPRVTLTAPQRLALAVNLCTLREGKGLSQLEVSHLALGLSKSHAAVSRLERGILADVEVDRLEKLATFFETTRDALLENRTVDGSPNRAEEGAGLALFHTDRDFTPSANYGGRLTLARTSAGLSLAGLAAKLGHAGHGTLENWERELVTPRKDTFIDLAVALCVPVSWLMFGRRVDTPDRALALRLTAMQKLYGLSNGEVAALMNPTSDPEELLNTSRLVHRLSVARQRATPETLAALATAFQVPAEWLSPPDAVNVEQCEQVAAITGGSVPVNKAARKLILDIVELSELGVLTDEAIRELRSHVADTYTAPYIRTARRQPVTPD